MIIKRIKELPVEKVFLFVALLFGFLYVFILPPFQSVDEASHFYRGYEIVTNKLVPQKNNGRVGDYLPSSLREFSSQYDYLIKNIDAKVSPQKIIESGKIKLNQDKTEFVDFQNTALYSPVTYLTQVPGMYVSKVFNANPLMIFYLGRLSNLLFFTLIVYFAIKSIPFYKLPLMTLALAPMTLSLAGALTSDVVVIGVNFLWVALLVKLACKKTQINVKEIISLVLLASVLALSTHYFMLIPLIFILPKTIFKDFSKYLICVISVLSATIISILLWQNLIGDIYINLNQNANVTEQLNFIFSHPLAYAGIFLKTLIVKLPRIIITMIGVLGWQDTRLDFMTYILYPILILLAVVSENKTDFKFNKWQTSLILLDIFASAFIIFTSMYLMWSAVGSSLIMGLNGKYFTPIMLPFLLLFYNRTKISLDENQKNNMKLFIYLAIALILLSSELSLLHRFYNLTPNLYYSI